VIRVFAKRTLRWPIFYNGPVVIPFFVVEALRNVSQCNDMTGEVGPSVYVWCDQQQYQQQHAEKKHHPKRVLRGIVANAGPEFLE
jgi:hypothetical protein